MNIDKKWAFYNASVKHMHIMNINTYDMLFETFCERDIRQNIH